jgi:hypothetical protein
MRSHLKFKIFPRRAQFRKEKLLPAATDELMRVASLRAHESIHLTHDSHEPRRETHGERWWCKTPRTGTGIRTGAKSLAYVSPHRFAEYRGNTHDAHINSRYSINSTPGQDEFIIASK